MDNLLSRIEILALLKKNAPGVFQKYALTQSGKINSKLSILREKYKASTTDQEKQSIKKEAEKLTEEWSLYKIIPLHRETGGVSQTTT